MVANSVHWIVKQAFLNCDVYHFMRHVGWDTTDTTIANLLLERTCMTPGLQQVVK